MEVFAVMRIGILDCYSNSELRFQTSKSASLPGPPLERCINREDAAPGKQVSLPRRLAYLERTAALATTPLGRWSMFDAPVPLNSTEQDEEFSKTRLIGIADRALSMGVDPLRILLAQSLADHFMQFGVCLDFSGHKIAS